jgi:hypothetical protein
MWHSGGMKKGKIDKKANKKPDLRFCVPPYWVSTMCKGVPILSYPGN